MFCGINTRAEKIFDILLLFLKYNYQDTISMQSPIVTKLAKNESRLFVSLSVGRSSSSFSMLFLRLIVSLLESSSNSIYKVSPVENTIDGSSMLYRLIPIAQRPYTPSVSVISTLSTIYDLNNSSDFRSGSYRKDQHKSSH